MAINRIAGGYRYLPKTPLSGVAEELKLDRSVFKSALDKAVDSLNKVSAQEIKADKLIAQYIDGKASLEDVMIEVEKANLAVSLALTVINTTVQTFKEILQMPV